MWTYMGDVNSASGENWQKLLSSIDSPDASFDGDCNENTLNVNKKYELHFLDQANSSSDPSQILILQFPIPRAFLPPSPSLSNFNLANWNSPQHNPHHVLHQFPFLFLPNLTTSYCQYWIYQIIRKAKLFKCVSKLHKNHNSLWIIHATHQKANSLRAPSLSKLDNMLNNSSIFDKKYAEVLTKW